MNNKRNNIAIVYSDPSPTQWEKEKRKTFIRGKNNGHSTENLVIEDLRNEILEEIDRVKKALEIRDRQVTVIPVGMELQNFIEQIQRVNPACIFNFFESSNGNSLQEMNFSSVMDFLNLKYTGSKSFTLGLAVHKNLVKDLLVRNGIPTPEFWFIPVEKEVPSIGEYLFPLIIKPNREDASIGIDNEAVVYTQKQLTDRVSFVHEQFKQPAIVERYISGRELNVSIIGNRKLRVLPISEIDYSQMPAHLHNIVTYEAKWAEKSVYFQSTIPVCPTQLPKGVEEQVQEIALAAFRVIGCRHYARIDLRLDEKENPFVLEVNPNPDISPDAGFPRSALQGGISYDDLINDILDLALEEES
jgi:D-alanine-D-alanine ligase